MAAIDLYDFGVKHGGFAVREQTINLKRNIVLDISKIGRHINTRITFSDRAEIEGRLSHDAAFGLYRQGFIDQQGRLGVSLEQATTAFPIWVRSCMEIFFTPYRFGGMPPRIVLPDPAAALCAEMQDLRPFQACKKARTA